MLLFDDIDGHLAKQLVFSATHSLRERSACPDQSSVSYRPFRRQIFSVTIVLRGVQPVEGSSRPLLSLLTYDFWLHGCVGALDGILFRVLKPHNVFLLRKFFCCKEMHAIPVQAVVSSSYNFLYMSAMCEGSTNNSIAFAVTGLGMRLRAVGLRSGYWIAGDAAYECRDDLLAHGVRLPCSFCETKLQETLLMSFTQALAFMLDKPSKFLWHIFEYYGGHYGLT